MNINIKETLLAGERVTLECKKASKGVPNSLWDTYSAFANTYGGTILLGVVEHMDEQDNTKRFEIVGVEDADKIRKDLWNTVNSREKVNINLLYDDDIQTIDIDGKKIIAINVPRADYTVRPVYINNNLSRGTFKRNHEGDYHCTEQELKMMLVMPMKQAMMDCCWNTTQWTTLTSQHWNASVRCFRTCIQSINGTRQNIRSF